jgi:hypothetical protein
MVRFGHFLILMAAVASAVPGVTVAAQTAAREAPMSHGKSKLVPPAVSPAPFSTDGSNRQAALSIEFRTAAQMAEKDRYLAADAESSVAEHAGTDGFAFEQGKWSYQQVVCPALPNHLFLQYTRNNGVGDVTMFTASIPRGGEGRVRIIPILRRGYSLFSPAPINALTISAFNHIRAEEPEGTSSNWLGNGLCYAALAGAHPQVPKPDEELDSDGPAPALTAAMGVEVGGGEVIQFADIGAKPKPMEWTMTFTPKGKLVSAKHFPAPLFAEKRVPQSAPELKSRPVPQDDQN